MTNEQQQVKEMMLAFSQECPEKPTIPSLEVRKLRAKLILEEALETVIALGIEPRIRIYTRANTEYGFDIQLNEHPFGPNLKEILDGCEDLKVVTEGTLLACGLTTKDKLCACGDADCYTNCYATGEDPHFNEVMRSNMSKMWTRKEVENIGCKNSIPGNQEVECNGYYIQFMQRAAAFSERCYIAKDKDGKFIKSPSYSPPNFNL